MKSKILDHSFICFGLVLGFVLCFTLIGGCLPADPSRTRVLDPQGTVVWDPGPGADRVLQLPPTGRPTVDYYIAALASGIYAALGYSIRKVKVNGAETTKQIYTRLTDLEKKSETQGIPLDPPLQKEELRRLMRLLELEASIDKTRPLGDGTSQ